MKRTFAILLVCLLSVGVCTFSACKNNPRVVITLDDGRTMTAELYPDVAPESVANFLRLVDAKAYDGVVFHRIIENFMVQTGGYYIEGDDLPLRQTGRYYIDTATNDPVFEEIYYVDNVRIKEVQSGNVKGEFSANGVQNDLHHSAGVLSMARAQDYNSGSSQFFICVADYAYGDGLYAAFGKLVDDKSLQVAISLSEIATDYVYPFGNDCPTKIIRIATVRRAK